MDAKRIKIIFVIPEKVKNESECSEDMHQAYEMCKQNSFDVKWIKEENYKNIETHKTSILVFQSFEGKCFNSVKDSKATRIVGPWCLLTCIVEGLSVPNLPWPILNVAMLNCVIACSNLSKNLKQELKYKIQCMGGQYTDALMAHNTHLITDSVKSEKYVRAADAKVKVMLSSWVEEVWIASQKANIHADDKEFNKHVCLPFHNLQICSTGFTDVKERKELEQLVTKNGAIYNGQLYVGKTDVLICKNTTSSEKYKVARKTNHIQCVTFEWIVDSIKNGYALPETSYCVRKGTSTPTKDEEALNPNFSMISAISSASMTMPSRYILEETVNVTSLSGENLTRKRKSSDAELNEIIDGIDIKAVKQAGTFLDGCGIYLVGFTPEQKEKLCKVLNFSGATRYEDLSERITHVIVGDSSCHEYKLLISKGLPSPSVNINWLTESIKNKQPVSEESYIMELSSPMTDSGPPLSKKSLQQSKAVTSENEIPSKYFDDNYVEADGGLDLIQQYLKGKSNNQEDTLAQYLRNNTGIDNVPKRETANACEETANTCTASIDETEQSLIFEGLKFLVLNFDKNEYNELKECIESGCGETVQESDEDTPDYVVLPVYKTEQPAYTKAKIVTDYWITECIRENDLRKILYYHQPYPIEKTDILRGCVITISSYAQCERVFLINLIQYLGAISQEQLARVVKGEVLATTHLLSCEASGKKYAAAIKWKLPVINKDWLLECARTGTFVSEKKYLIGDATVLDPQENVQSANTTIVKQSTATSTTLEQGSTFDEISETLKSKNSNTPIKQTHITRIKNSNVLASLEKFTSNERINQTSPKCNKFGSAAGVEVQTPVNRMIKYVKTAEVNTPMSPPVNKIMQQVRMWHGGGTTPVTPKLKGELDDISTPDTPYGAFIRPNPSPHLRKVMLKWINDAPDHRPRRDSTPLSELKRQLWNKICQPKEVQDENKSPTRNNETYSEEDQIPKEKNFEEDENVIVNNLQQLQEMLTASGGNRKSMKKRLSTLPAEASTSALKDSQPCTVAWDYVDCNEVFEQVNDPTRKQNFIFIFSGVDSNEKENMSSQLQNLGAVVTDLINYDPNCTHLISAKVGRNEKLMSAMAAGKWILHPSYVKESVAAGKLLDEEEFEYGNPKAAKNVNNSLDKNVEAKVELIHWWRKEISRRGYGAFHDMRAIIVATKRHSLVRVIEAGGGMVIDASPPFNESVFATHCILEVKIIPDLSAYIPLAKQGIYCVHISYINNFLHRTVNDIRDCILPFFSQYYNQE